VKVSHLRSNLSASRRTHDLRHGAATLLLAAGHDMKVVQETLGLSSITIAADTYTSVLPQLARQSAEDVAALIRPAATPAGPASRDRTDQDQAPQGQSKPGVTGPDEAPAVSASCSLAAFTQPVRAVRRR
jgi:hypothetical protein